MAARVCTVVWRAAIGFGQGGYLELESAPGKVTTFHVYFASLKCAANIRAGEAVAGRGSGGGAQYVLDVDVDDKVMLSLAEQLLERAGCRVSTGLVSKELWARVRALGARSDAQGVQLRGARGHRGARAGRLLEWADEP